MEVDVRDVVNVLLEAFVDEGRVRLEPFLLELQLEVVELAAAGEQLVQAGHHAQEDAFEVIASLQIYNARQLRRVLGHLSVDELLQLGLLILASLAVSGLGSPLLSIHGLHGLDYDREPEDITGEQPHEGRFTEQFHTESYQLLGV